LFPPEQPELPAESPLASSVQEVEEEKKEDDKSSSTSEFIPDPDFLAKVNENIRRNNNLIPSEPEQPDTWRGYQPDCQRQYP